MHCRPNQVLPTVMHPTKCCKVNNYSTYEVPHVHPQHTTIVNNQMYQHKHYFPQTQSMVDSVSHQHQAPLWDLDQKEVLALWGRWDQWADQDRLDREDSDFKQGHTVSLFFILQSSLN
ncbi:spore coat protein [Bacillus sp. SG-1]|uniref:spore coat protein n=1 Tax=Bacillus sp. SG-1 TaxID=161544 RepID=UPI0012EA9D1A|nr:spore coat protein [Bacillus sp. SG-1]